MDIVDQLEKDLLIYERRKRSEKKDDAALAEIKTAETILHDLRKRSEQLNQERVSIQTHGLDRTKRALAKVEDEYRKLGGDLFDERLEIERRLSEADKLAQESVEVQREIAAGVLPLLLVKPLLESADARDRHEEECRRARELSDVLQVRDRGCTEPSSVSIRRQRHVWRRLNASSGMTARNAVRSKKKKPSWILLQRARSDLHSLLRRRSRRSRHNRNKTTPSSKRSATLQLSVRVWSLKVSRSVDTIAESSAQRD